MSVPFWYYDCFYTGLTCLLHLAMLDCSNWVVSSGMQLVALPCRFIMFATDALLSAAENSLAVGSNQCPPLPQMTENRFCKGGKCTIVNVARHNMEQNIIDIMSFNTSRQSWFSLDVQRYFTPSDKSCWWSIRMLLMFITSPIWQGGVFADLAKRIGWWVW